MDGMSSAYLDSFFDSSKVLFMSLDVVISISECESFVDKFIAAVDFQESVPVSADTELANLPEWDSLAALGVIVMCDTDYGTTITGDDLKRCVTVGDIFRIVETRKAG